ncbi:hypothetical protein SAMN04487995_1285 [Dyadobacter koreensis]|uniref:Dolichyl-phosphate-mannose-protein mannosyltransferase n=1 Tax=Dyadobacter koreensis TaxID=408657 RepID=A0A1H6RFT7_9BACT|nr:hypothetical protein [Dyadobacter koreensis]SEI54688.1 hypothetical protein SAMN04487995_1285 [Dyadobacter koreensis]
MKNVVYLPVRILTVFIVFYLLLPNLLFQTFWFRMELAVPMVTGLVVSFYFYLNNEISGETRIVYFSYIQIFFLIIFAFFLTVISGVGGFSYQTNDFVGHNSKFFDLSNNPWPIYFDGADTFGCYYWGYYLVPSVIGKLTGGVSETAIFLWTYTGVLAGITMAFIVLKNNMGRLVLLFAIGGIGHTIKVIFGIVAGVGFTHPIVFIEVWNLLNQLMWAPNQLIPILMIASLVYYKGVVNRDITTCLFPLTLILIWSVFPTITLSLTSLLIFIFFGFFKNLKKINLTIFITSVAVPVFCSLPVLNYFLASAGIPIRGFIWTFQPLSPILMDYSICVFLDILALWFVWKHLIVNRCEVPDLYFYGLLGIILIFALYRFGFANDWLVRGTMPVFMILFFAILRGNLSFSEQGRSAANRGLKFAFTGLMLLCLAGPFSYLYRASQNNVIRNAIAGQQLFHAYPYNKYKNIFEAIKEHHGDPEAAQYLGNKQSNYWISLSNRRKDVGEIIAGMRIEAFKNQQTQKYLYRYL